MPDSLELGDFLSRALSVKFDPRRPPKEITADDYIFHIYPLWSMELKLPQGSRRLIERYDWWADYEAESEDESVEDEDDVSGEEMDGMALSDGEANGGKRGAKGPGRKRRKRKSAETARLSDIDSEDEDDLGESDWDSDNKSDNESGAESDEEEKGDEVSVASPKYSPRAMAAPPKPKVIATGKPRGRPKASVSVVLLLIDGWMPPIIHYRLYYRPLPPPQRQQQLPSRQSNHQSAVDAHRRPKQRASRQSVVGGHRRIHQNQLHHLRHRN